MNIYDIDTWIKHIRDENGGIIPPEAAMKVLQKTNHFAHIKKILKNIKEKCQTPEQIAPYKEFILSCVDKREMSDIALDELRQLATKCGCIEELEQLHKKSKIYSKYDCENIHIVDNCDRLKILLNENHKNLDVTYDNEYPTIFNADFSNLRRLSFSKPCKLNIYMSKNPPEIMNLTNCQKINILDLDFRRTKEIYFGSSTEILLIDCSNLPETLDFSQAERVNLSGSDLAGVKELKFAKGSTVRLRETTNLPEILNLSMCEALEDIDSCDLSTVKEIKLKNAQQKKKFLKDINFEGKITYTQSSPFEKLFGKKFE